MRLGFGEVQRFDVLRDRAGKPFAYRHSRDVNGFGIEALRGVEFKLAFAQEVDRTDFAAESAGDNFYHAVELVLRVGAAGHDLVQVREDLAS